jgi:hypothetical protein
MKSLKLIIIYGLILNCFHAISQSDTLSSVHSEKDTLPYITDMSDLLGLRLYFLRKSNNLEITKGNNTLELNPNGLMAIGVGFNYKSFGIGIGFGIPNTAKSNQKKGKTNQFDLQFSVYGKSIGIDGYLQVYKGYYNTNPNDFVEWTSDTLPQLPEMKIVSVGISAFYIFNAKKFSYKAAFVRNQIQNKSAGSLAVGIFGTYDNVDSPGGFIPHEFPDSLKTQFDLSAFRAISLGVYIGYMYSFVLSKKFFINLAALPGYGVREIEIINLANQKASNIEPAPQLLARASFGFENRNFYITFTASILVRSFEYKEFGLDLSTEQFRLTFGKRINVNSKK